MNAFALILLSWPFYLAVNGRLSNYIDLAKPKEQGNAENKGGDPSGSSSLVSEAIMKIATTGK